MRLKKNDAKQFANLRNGLLEHHKSLTQDLAKVKALLTDNMEQIKRYNDVVFDLQNSGFEVEEFFVNITH